MPAVQETIDTVATLGVEQYKYGFETIIESDVAPKGLTEDTIRFISAKKNEPSWMLEWRLDAFRRWQTMVEPEWARVNYPKIDFQDIHYYAAPKNTPGPSSLAEVDPELLKTYAKLGIPLKEQEIDSMKKIRVLLVDDHALFREGLAVVISSQPDMEVVGNANDGLEAVIKAQELKPDLILMDIQMSTMDGLEATRQIKQILPDTTIVVLTVRDDDEKLFEALKSGAQGYLLKDIRSHKMIEMLQSAMNGEAAITLKNRQRRNNPASARGLRY